MEINHSSAKVLVMFHEKVIQAAIEKSFNIFSVWIAFPKI